ncbi:MAG: PaaI family thioesterase [Alphaproteobacteria bacterium]|nr:PaaI family thioesterase [Alphaproteobacteria bacterium]
MSDVNVKEKMVRFETPNPRFAARVRDSFHRQAFMEFLGADLVTIVPGAVDIRLPYRAELGQQHGFFHGGVVGTLADNAGGYAGFTLAPADSSILTVEYKVNLLAPATGETLIARGRVIRAGRSLVVARADVAVEAGGVEKLVATALVTLMLMAGMADAPHRPKPMDGSQ